MQQAILVLGMGRSGTSMLAKVLALCGGGLPGKLLPAAESNAKGHFEPLDALAINTDFLAAFGSTWHDPTLRLQQPGHVFPASALAELRDRIAAFLAENEQGAPLVIKEPRIAALAPLWFDVLAGCGWETKVIVPLRHPGEVRQSLRRRDAIPDALSDMLWLKYNLLAEWYSRGKPRVFVQHRALFKDWRAEIARIAAALDIPLHPRRNARKVDAFIDPQLVHHAASRHDAFETPWTMQTYRLLDKACAHGEPDTRKLDAIRTQFMGAEAMMRSASTFFDHALPPLGVRTGKPLPSLVAELVNDFSEAGYLAANPDVAQSVQEGVFASGLEHWLAYGRAERRLVRPMAHFAA